MLVVLCLAAIVAGLRFAADRRIRVLVITAAASGIGYLLLPTGATGIRQDSGLFSVDLRYATPTLALGTILLPILVRSRFPRALKAVGPGLAGVLVVTQLDRSLWPTQTLRHAAAIAALGAAAAVIVRVRTAPSLSRPVLAGVAGLCLVGAGAAVFGVQRHYFARRYQRSSRNDPGLADIYRWAQRTAHARIAIYGTWKQYPLYGARDTNRVDYLGSRTADGGFTGISDCRSWREIVTHGRYQYVVLTASAGPASETWTESDPSATLVLAPGLHERIYRITRPMHPLLCP